MGQYRNKTIVEAVQFLDNAASIQEIHKFMGAVETRVNYDDPTKPFVGISTIMEGEKRAFVGDWIVKDAHGEFFPLSPGIFVATYETVT